MFDAVNWRMEEPNTEPVRIIDSMRSPEKDGTAPKKCMIIDGSMGDRTTYAQSCSVEAIINNMNYPRLILDRICMDCLESIDVRESYDYVCVFHEKNCELGSSKSDRLQKTDYYIAVQNLLDNEMQIQNIFQTMEETHTGIAFSPLPIYFLQNGRLAENNSFWCTWKVFLELYKSNILSDTRRKLQTSAKQVGYSTCVVMSDVYAGLQWNNSETIIGGIVTGIKWRLQLGDYMELKSSVRLNWFDLIRFAQQHSRIAVYGTGVVADIITDFFSQRCLEISFYIVSEGYRKESVYRDKPVYELQEVRKDEELGIVVALNRKHAEEIKGGLEEKRLSNEIFFGQV